MFIDGLTEKRLIVMAVLLQIIIGSALVLTAFGYIPALKWSNDTFFTDAETITYVVQPGDSLWSIAKRFRPGEDPEEVVQDIQKISRLNGSYLEAYQQIKIPLIRGRDG